jgi:hypothetical protein
LKGRAVFDVTNSIFVYGLGVAVGLALADGRPATRLGLALLWPVGPVAFLVTLAMLAAASLIAFPRVAGLVAAAAAVWWWFAGA